MVIKKFFPNRDKLMSAVISKVLNELAAIFTREYKTADVKNKFVDYKRQDEYISLLYILPAISFL